jgi:glycosyltransferase involved in cell wall biosynthesis
MNERTKISVGVITYNQETTIRQTLDSILAQKGDFDLELVIGEDCGPDTTYAICADYAERYPDVVKLLPNTKNLGIMANFARVMKACTGDYVGICAGDDYWCDAQKLQKQLEYFKVHKDVGVVSTSGYRHFVLRDEIVPGINPLRPIEDGDIKKFYFSKDYPGGVYAMPLSLLIKRDLMQHIDFDEFVKRGFPVEDYPMQAILAQHCKWGHINDICVVYRVYKESATFISFDHPKYLQYHKGLANIRRYLNEIFPDDACFSEEWLQEYEFYKEFLLYLHKFEYKKAKQLIVDAAAIADTPKVKQAKRFSKTWLHFVVARYIKERKYRKDLKKKCVI